MPKLRFHSLDDPSNPDERIITVDNGLSKLTSPAEYKEIVLRFRRTRNHHIMIDMLEGSDSAIWGESRKKRPPKPVVKAHWVNADTYIWLVLDDCEMSAIASVYLKPFLSDFTSDIFRFLKWPLTWEDEVDDESGSFK